MADIFKGINKKFMKLVYDGMDEDGKDYLDIPFNEFKELTKCETNAKSIKSITHSVTMRMNEVGPSNWFFKVGSRKNGDVVHILRIKKEAYCFD
ncbi:MAG: hypothetical protein M8352_09745 [ANME-2 cluster archaeon]|nr:hypothetical protein [ANME-2 cluster archaeon]